MCVRCERKLQMEVSDNNFPLYLSSNACPIIYPKNTANNFRTRLNKPLRLDGKWEVGLKNISYGAQIEDKAETASVELMVTSYKNLSVNEIYDYEFITNKNRWIGFQGVYPKSFEKDIDHVLNILDTLNNMNHLIIKNADKTPLFNFSTTVKDGRTFVVFRNYDPSFVIKITPRMSSILGFHGRTQFEGSDAVIAPQVPLAHKLAEIAEKEAAEKAAARKLAEIAEKKAAEKVAARKLAELDEKEAAKKTAVRKSVENAENEATKNVEKKSKTIVAAPTNLSLPAPLITVEVFPPQTLSDNDTEGISRTKRGASAAQNDETVETKRLLSHAAAADDSKARTQDASVMSRQSDSTEKSANEGKVDKSVLKVDDYKLTYLCSNVQSREQIVFKPTGVGIGLSRESIRPEEEVVRYIRKIAKLVKIEAAIKNGKIIISNKTKNAALEFSSDFMKSVIDIGEKEKHLWRPHCPCVLFPESKLVVGIQHLRKDNQVSNKWFLNVYNTNLDLTKRKIVKKINVPVNPWLEKNISAAISHINEKVKSAVAGALHVDYQSEEHKFLLSLISQKRAKLEHGENILPRFRKNLAYLLALPEEPLRELVTVGEREVDVLENRRRQLYILSNIIPATSFGEEQHHILSDFLHKGGNTEIIDKTFRPVIYHSVNNTNLNDIHIEIVTDNFKAISMKDTVTILTLHFRRVN